MGQGKREPTESTQPNGIPVPKRKVLGRAEKLPPREKRRADTKADVWTRNSYFGFVIGLLDRPARKDSTRPSDPPTRPAKPKGRD